MRVAVKANSAIEQHEIGECNSWFEDVFVYVVTRAGVHKQDIVLDMAVRQFPQPLDAFLADGVYSPPHHGRGVIVEPLENLGVSACSVVVADECEPLAPGDLVDTSLGVATIADDIAEAERCVAGRAVAEHRLQ